MAPVPASLLLLLGACGSRIQYEPDPPDDNDRDTSPDTADEFDVTCETTVVPAEPCLVAADGSGAFTTIQEAVDAAGAGETITVCPGYYEPVLIDRVSITIRGYSRESTCISGAPTTPALAVQGVTVDFSGFTVVGSNGEAPAIAISGASGTLHDLRVAGASSSDSESAVVAEESAIAWEDITFDHNSTHHALALWGGEHQVRHCVFTHNVIGIDITHAAVVVTNSLFTDGLGGLSILGSTGTIANNVFFRNVSGAQVYDFENGHMVVRNNVAQSNAAGFEGTYRDMDYNVGWDNESYDWSGYEGPHDTSVDPRFVNAEAGDFRLKWTSAHRRRRSRPGVRRRGRNTRRHRPVRRAIRCLVSAVSRTGRRTGFERRRRVTPRTRRMPRPRSGPADDPNPGVLVGAAYLRLMRDVVDPRTAVTPAGGLGGAATATSRGFCVGPGLA